MLTQIPRSRRLPSVTTFLVLFSFLILPGCDQDVVLNLEHSINIFHPGPKWPNVKKFSPTEREVYQRFGKPDCFRVLYDRKGSIKLRHDLEKELNGKKPKKLPPYTWVYLNRDKEVFFEGQTFVEKPIADTTRIVIDNGDPEDVREVTPGIVQWMFFSTGKLYKISNDRVIEQKEFQAMGRYLK